MKTTLLILAAMALGYRLPPLVERLRRHVRRRIFTPVLLHPYAPAAEEGSDTRQPEGRP